MNFYKKVIALFNKHNVSYLIVGGIAVTLYGADRTTHDLDIWIKNTTQNLQILKSVFQELGYKKDGIEKAIAHLSKGETIIVKDKENGFLKIDLMGYYSSFLTFDEANSMKNSIEIGDAIANVISISHLVETKIRAGRQKDLLDAKALKKIMNRENKP
jgi:hypothetical protein